MVDEHQVIRQRLQITFGKFGALKYTSNLDVAKLWERVLRRASLPILYSEGFNPRPRMQLATALPLGITSECELLDVSLRESVLLEGLVERLLAVSPAGLQIYAIQEVPPRSPTLQNLVRSAEYRIHFDDPIDPQALRVKIDMLLASDSLNRTSQKKGKTRATDLRPLIYSLFLDEIGDLIAHVAVGAQGNLRPDDLLRELGLENLSQSVHRFRLHLEGMEPVGASQPN